MTNTVKATEWWIEWIISDVADVLNGYAFKSSDLWKYKDWSFPVFKMWNINRGWWLRWTWKEDYYNWDTNKIDKKFFTQPYDILMSMTDMQASMELLWYSARIKNEKFIVNQRVWIIRPKKEKIDPDYLSYFMNNKTYIDLVRTKAHSWVQVNLTTEWIKTSPVWYPQDSNEQKAIAKVLSCFDNKIELLKAENQTIEEIGQILFKEYFGKYKSWDGLPIGWKIGTLWDIIDHVKISIIPSKEPEVIFSHYSLPAFDEWKRPSKEKWELIMSNKYKVIDNCILISKLNPFFPRIRTIFRPEDNAVCSTEFQVLKPKDEIYFSYCHCLLNSQKFTNDISKKVQWTSSSHQRVKPDDILNSKIIIWDKQSVNNFHTKYYSMLKKIENNKKQIEKLSNMRDQLLPKLMSWKIRVKF